MSKIISLQMMWPSKKKMQDCLENPLGLIRDLIKVADYKTNKYKKQLAFLYTSNNLLENLIKNHRLNFHRAIKTQSACESTLK